MKRITKRIIAFCLTLVLLFSSCISVWGAKNEEEPVQAKIRVETPENSYKLNVYIVGNEYMFSMEDLAVLTGYFYEYNDAGGIYDLFYTRGAKTLELYLDVNKMFAVLEGETIKMVEFDTPPMMINDTWYLPGSEILPWMNVFCFRQNIYLFV